MRHLRRLLGWAVFLACLSALGAGVFHFVRYRPRCTIVGPFVNDRLSPNGSRLVTVRGNKNEMRGPLQVWDTLSGRVVHEWFAGAQVETFEYSPDDRHVAISLDDGLLRLVDWHAGQVWPIEEPKRIEYCYFSPQGRWLFIHAKAPGGDMVLDMKTRQISLRMDESLIRSVPDERWAFTRKLQADKVFEVWDLAAAKKVGSIQSEVDQLLTSPDGKSVVSWLLDDKTDRAEAERLRRRIPDSGVEVWSLPTGHKRFRLEFPTVGIWGVAFSRNSQILATWLKYDNRASKMQVRRAENGRILWETAVIDPLHGDFAPDSTLFWLAQGGKTRTLTMFDAATGRKVWERPDCEWGMHFVGESGILLHNENTLPLFLDARTGEQKATGPPGFRTSTHVPTFTIDGQYFVIGGHQERGRPPFFWEAWLERHWANLLGEGLEGALVMESATGRELFRVLDCGRQRSDLSDDAGTLITADVVDNDGTSMIRVWDVAPTKAWLWAVGTALGAGLVLRFLVFRWVRAFFNRKKAAGGPTMKPEGE
jgi:WD40 repeat protein